MINFNKFAELLDAVALYVDNIEYQKTAGERADRDAKLEQIATRYVEKTGEGLTDASREKLSNLDNEALSEILKIAAVADGSEDLESLGGPANSADTSGKPLSTKEAAAQADDQFLNWIVS